MKIERLILPFILIAGAAPAMAQTPPPLEATGNLKYDPPTHTVPDAQGLRSVLQGALALTKYKVFVDSKPIPNTLDPNIAAPTVEAGPTAVSVDYKTQAAVGSTLYARISACHQYGCGPLSAEVSKVVPVPQNPGPVENVQFTIVLSPQE